MKKTLSIFVYSALTSAIIYFLFSSMNSSYAAFIVFVCVFIFLQKRSIQTSSKISREAYISIINHDLKIPVLAQIRALELLSNDNSGKISPEQKEPIDLTLDSCRFMYEMLSIIIFSHKYENNEIPLNIEMVTLYKLLNNCFDISLKLPRDKNLTIKTLPEDNSITIPADKLQIKKAFEKIIEYCILTANDNTEISYKTSFRKNNICIFFIFESSFNHSNIFEINNADKMDKVGSSLGLHLAKQIIKAHKGKITITQKDNKNVFEVSLPYIN